MKFLINQYSFIALSILLTAAAGFILLRKPELKHYLAFALIVIGLSAAWVILRPRQTALMTDSKTVKAMIGAGTPVLLEFQSPY